LNSRILCRYPSIEGSGIDAFFSFLCLPLGQRLAPSRAEVLLPKTRSVEVQSYLFGARLGIQRRQYLMVAWKMVHRLLRSKADFNGPTPIGERGSSYETA
jgi:hypothetical protein